MNANPDLLPAVPKTGDLVNKWLQAYQIEKEREFIKLIDEFIPKDRVDLLDIGCGIGLHTHLWAERCKNITASDFSAEFRDYILRTYRFPFIWNDVLNCTIREQYDICFCMAIGTILHDEGPRFQTFETLGKLIRADAFLVLVFPSNQPLFGTRSKRQAMHSIDGRDIAKLKTLGLEVKQSFCWSSSPKFLWRSPVLRVFALWIEWFGCCLGVGARKVVICQRKPF